MRSPKKYELEFNLETNLHTIIKALGRGKERRLYKKAETQGWLTFCPAHADKIPTLIIKNTPEGVSFHCSSGCDPMRIVDCLAELGLLGPDFI